MVIGEIMRLGVVIPCFNEEEVLTETKNRLERLLGEMIEEKEVSEDSFICL